MNPTPDATVLAGEPIAPIRPHERLRELDVLRGFTLIGVLLVNISDFTRNSHEGLDPWWYQALGAATGGKFATLFQLMFGIGFAVQMDRWRGPASHQVPRYVLRCAVLFAIGWAAEFLGSGMILVGYAMTALGLLFFRNVRARTLLVSVAVFLVLYSWKADQVTRSQLNTWSSRDSVTAVLRQQAASARQDRMMRLVRQSRAESASFFRSRSLWLQGNFERFRQGLVLPNLGTFTLFLLGMILWRKRAFLIPAERSRRRLLYTTLALTAGLAGQLWAAQHVDDGGVRSALEQAQRRGTDFVTMTLLSLGYASSVLMLYRAGVLARLWSLLAWQGRMGLTVFILQNFVLVWIFSDWGLGFKNLSYRWDVPLTLIITTALLVVCRVWLSRFRSGPVEGLWRFLTYGMLGTRGRTPEVISPATS